MKIQKARFENYRSHRVTEVDLARFTVVRGPNHSGKSSFSQALDTALARRSEITGTNGQGMADAIRFGEDKALIELDCSEAGAEFGIRASLTEKSGLDVKLKPKTEGWDPVGFKRRLDLSRDVLSCLCNSRFFVNRDDKTQKAILASLVLPATLDLPEETQAAMQKQGLALPDGQPIFAFIEGTYKKAFDDRTTLNRALKEWHAPERGKPYDGPNADEVRARLSQRQNERTELALRKQGLQRDIDEARGRKQELEQRAAQADARATSEQRQREEIAQRGLGKTALKTLEKEAAGTVEAKALDEGIQKRSREIELLTEQIHQVRDIERLGAQCPTCRQQITDAVLEALAVPLNEKFDTLNREQREAFDKRKDLGDPAGAQKKIDAHKTVEADLKRIDARVAKLKEDAEAARNEAAKITPDTMPQPETVDQELKEIDEKIERGSQKLSEATTAGALERAYADALARKGQLIAESEQLEHLVAFFGPNGIKAKLIEENIGGFQTKINVVLGAWGYQCCLQLEPEYGFQVAMASERSSYDGWWAPLHQLSESEKYRFSIAFAVALAIVSGWKFVVCDGADVLDQPSRSLLYGALIGSELDQAIVLATDLRDNTSSIHGSTFIRFSEVMEDGLRTTRADVLQSTPVA